MLGPQGPYPYADDYKTAMDEALEYAYPNYSEAEYGSDDSTDLQWRNGNAEEYTNEDYNAPV